MAFDRTDPADLAALKTEVTTDPIAMGYDPTGATTLILKLLNDPAVNVGGETAARPFDVAAMLDALDPTELDAQQTTVGTDGYVQALISSSLGGVDIEPYRAKFRALFAANSATVLALDAQTAALSRGEVLFGQGTTITRDDWIAARDS
jgi:hypothetical protein